MRRDARSATDWSSQQGLKIQMKSPSSGRGFSRNLIALGAVFAAILGGPAVIFSFRQIPSAGLSTTALIAVPLGIVISLIAAKSLESTLLEQLLGVYVVLFSLSKLSVVNMRLQGVSFPVYLAMLPALAIIAVIRSARSPELKGSSWKLEVVLLVFLLAFTLLSVNHSIDPSASLLAVGEMAMFVLGYLLFSYLIASERMWERLVWLYVICTCLVMAKALYNYYFKPIHWSRLVFAKGGSANQAAFLAEFALLSVAGFMVSSEHRWRKTVGYALVFAILSLGIVLTLSRGALLALASGLIVLVVLSFGRLSRRRLVIIGVITILLLSVAVPSLSDVLGRARSVLGTIAPFIDIPTQDNALGMPFRLATQRRYLSLALEAPLSGRGFGLGLDEFGMISGGTPHNSLLAMLFGAGFPALLFLLAFLIVHGVGLWEARRLLNELGPWGNILFASYICLLVHALLTNFIVGHTFWTLLGFQGAAIRLSSLGRPTADEVVDSQDTRHAGTAFV